MSDTPVAAWSEVPNGDVHWWAVPGLCAALFSPAGLRLSDWLKDGRATVVKQGPHRMVYRVELPGDQVVYLKHNLLPDLRAWLRQLVRPSKARMELDRAVIATTRGVATIEPLALGERQTLLGACDSFLITRGLSETQTLNSFLAGTLAPMPPARRARVRQRLAVAMGKFVARLHDAGICHNDLHAANIMVRLTADDQLQLFMIDLSAVQVGARLGWATSRNNLVLLARWFVPRATRADRLRFWRAFYEERRLGVWPDGVHGHREHFAMAHEIERRALESMLAFWKHRDARCFANNRYYRRLRRPGLVGHASTDLHPALLSTLLDDPDAPFQWPGARLLKDSSSSTVAELEWTVDGKTRRYILKRFRVADWTDPWVSMVRASSALRSWRFGQGFRERCLPTARPLAVLHRVKAGLACEGYLLTEKIEPAVDLRGFVADLAALPAELARQRLHLAIEAVARAVRQLHRCNLSHRDLKAANLLIATDPERPHSPFLPAGDVPPNTPLPSLLPLPASQVWFIDLAGVSLHAHLSRRQRVQNLARLHASFHQSPALTRTDKLRFLRSYLLWNLVGKGGWKNWWKAINGATLRKVERNRRSGRILA